MASEWNVVSVQRNTPQEFLVVGNGGLITEVVSSSDLPLNGVLLYFIMSAYTANCVQLQSAHAYVRMYTSLFECALN